MSQLIDLHTHTTASDGTLTPTELVQLARSKGLVAVAITDHDTVEGLPEALAAGADLNFDVVPGVEISVDFPAGEMHILGYFIDPGGRLLREGLEQLQQYRRERNPRIIEKLNLLGYPVTLEEVEAEAGGKVVGRPHMAAALVKKHYFKDIKTAFEDVLSQGRPAYVKKEKLSPQEGIDLILAAQGLPVLAHPQYLNLNDAELDNLVWELQAQGLAGLEAYYTSHTAAQTAQYLELAHRHGLVVTGGSDFHGGNKPEIELGAGHGNLEIPFGLLVVLRHLKKGAFR